VGSPSALTWEHLARLPWSPPSLGITEDLDALFFSEQKKTVVERGESMHTMILLALLTVGG